MPFQIVRGDYTKLQVDAIVNAANRSLLGGGGVDGRIHRAAGKELLEACKKLGGCEVGCVKHTPGFNLPCKYIIHAVGPIWQGGTEGEEQLLAACYRKSLALAKELGCNSIAMPLISSGAFGIPKEKVIKIATDEITSFLLTNEMMIYLMIWSKEAFVVSKKFFAAVEEYIDDNYVMANWDDKAEARKLRQLAEKNMPSSRVKKSLREAVIALLEEKNLTSVECYKAANIDKRRFSKIITNDDRRASKRTMLALCVGLKLTVPEANDFLSTLGFALTDKSKTDLVVKMFLERGIYDINEINAALFDQKLQTLGSKMD